MRFAVIILALFASFLTAFFGCFWVMPDVTDVITEAIRGYGDFGFLMPNTAEWYATAWAAFFMFVGAGLGILACVLLLIGRGKHAAVLMFLAMIGPATLSPVTLAFTAFQGFVGLLCLLIRPRGAAETPAAETAA